MKIVNQLTDFFFSIIREIQPDIIVPIDRKGTALIRALFEESHFVDGIDLNWSKILADSAIDHVNVDFFKGKNILIFDDTVYHGHSMMRVYNKLIGIGVKKETLFRAAFGVHESCDEQLTLDRYYCAQLSDAMYDSLREEVVSYLQWKGALLLDTEHLEVPIRLNCSRKDFFSALLNAGDVVEFSSYGSRISMSIHNPFLIDEENFRTLLPKNTLFDGEVCKCRIIERSDNRYALIPLYYPSIPTEINPSWRNPWQKLIHEYPIDSPIMDFQVAGLVGALQVVKSVVFFLKTLREQGKIIIELPEEGTKEDPLSHLRSIIPTISIQQLRRELMTVIEEGLVAKIRKSEHRGTQSKHYIEGKDFQFKKIMFPIVARIWELTELFDEPHGANFMEVLACSKYMNIDEAIVSATLDKAIDCGHVFAKQAEVNYEQDVKRITRIFCPEGEYVSSYIRRLVAMQ